MTASADSPNLAARLSRLLFAAGSLAAACAGQYWLTVRYDPSSSAAAWGAALVFFLASYVLADEARALPRAASAREPGRAAEYAQLALVLLVGLFFLVYRYDAFPPGLNHDAAWEGLYAIRILEGEPYTPYTPEAWGRETLTFYFRAASVWLMGTVKEAVWVPSMVAGFLALPFLYWWGRTWFGARFGLLVTLLLAVSGWHLVFSRTGWRSDFQPLFMIVTCCFFFRGMATARVDHFLLSGVSLALTLNTYNGSRVFPAVFALWLLLVVFVLRSWHWKGFLKRYGTGLLFMAVAFAITMAPLAWYALNHWNIFMGRAAALSSASTFSDALRASLLLFNWRGNGDDFFVREPALEFPVAVFLPFGVLWALLRCKDERALFIVLGLLINLIPGLVSKPNLNRDIGTMPFVYLAAALGVTWFAQQIRALVPRIGGPLALAFVLVAGGAATWATYAQYLGPRPRPVWGYYPETTVLGTYMKDIVPDYAVWVGGANFPRDSLTYLSYQGEGDPMRREYTWVDDPRVLLGERLVAPRGKGLAFLLASQGPSAQVFRVLQQRFPEHEVVELRYPPDGGPVFVRGLLVPVDGVAAARDVEITEETAAEPVAPEAESGRLSQPRGLSVAANGEIAVADFGNHRIQIFDARLRFLRGWGSQGQAAGRFNQPGAVAIGPNGRVFVADTWNQRVQVFTKDGEHQHTWAPGLYGPRGITVDEDGRVYVADTGNNRIVRLSADGELEKSWGEKGTTAGQFLEPVGIAVRDGEVYVADNGNGRLQVFTTNGNPVLQFDVSGWKSVVFSEPHAVVDEAGSIWVTVPSGREVRRYDRQGRVEKSIKGRSIAGAEFETPMGIGLLSEPAPRLVISDLAGGLLRIPLGESPDP